MAGPGGIPDSDWQKVQQYGQKYGVDPYLLVAIGIHETGWGKLGLGRKGLILGVGAYDSGPVYTWAGLDRQLDQGAKILANHGVKTIDDVKAGKAKFWTPSKGWAESVAKVHARITGGSDTVVVAENAALPGVGGIVDGVGSAIRESVNGVLAQAYNASITGLVFFTAVLAVLAGLVIVFRAPLSKAAAAATDTIGKLK